MKVRKLWPILLLLFALALVACGGSDDEEASSEDPYKVAFVYVVTDDILEGRRTSGKTQEGQIVRGMNFFDNMCCCRSGNTFVGKSTPVYRFQSRSRSELFNHALEISQYV